MGHTGISQSDATVLWTQVAVLLSLAWLLGLAARRVGQPPIVGSLLAGLVAGPSVFGQLAPSAFHWFHPSTAAGSGELAAVANFSLLVLLIGLGAETDLRLIRDLGGSAGAVISGSLILPLAAGVGVALLVPDSFLGSGAKRVSFVVLVAAALAVSSLPVIARLMSEMKLTRRTVGQLSIAAATVNDGVGFLALAFAVAFVAKGGATKVVIAAVGLVALIAVFGTGGKRVLDAAFRRSRRHGPDIPTGIAICAVFTFVVAAVAQGLGIDAALGAFVAGILIGRSRFVPPRALEAIEWASAAIFAPLYFATAGLSVDVTLLGKHAGAMWFAIALVSALLAKWGGVYASARVAGLASRDACALGFSLNGRGAMQVILASAGLTDGIITPSMFTIVILVSFLSSVLAPPAIRRTLRGWSGTAEEQERLEHEREMSTNVVVRGQRLLIPSRGSPNSVAAARILDLAWPEASEVTLLHVGDVDSDGLDGVRATLANRVVHEAVAEADDVVDAILSEANLGYGAVGVAAAEHPEPGRVLPSNIEQILNHSPIPVVLVRRGRQSAMLDGKPLIRPRRILCPVTGSAASRAGQEVAHNISQNTGANLALVHVVTRPGESRPRQHSEHSDRVARAVLDSAKEDADDKELAAATMTRIGASSGAEIHEQARADGSDLIVLGTTVRRVGDHPFLGHTVDHLLEHAMECTVVVVVLPDAQQVAAEEHIDREAG